MKANRSSANWLIDVALFIGFIALFFMELTGLALHQWLGVAAGALALYHLIRHSKWVIAVSQRFFGCTTNQARLCYGVDALLLLGFAAILVSGLLISSWLNVPLGYGATAWADFHILASRATLLLMVAKVALHWRWIARTARGLFTRPSVPVASKPVPAGAGITRRDFLKVMGGVGLAAALAMFHNIETTTTVAAQTVATPAASSPSAATTSTQGTTAAASASSSTTLTCAARCPKGRHCAYPGSCHSYTDANQNGLCDLGECS